MTIKLSSKSPLLPAILWVVSFLMTPTFVVAWQNQMFALSTILLYGWSYLMISRKMESGWQLSKSPVLLFAGLFWLLVLASVFWSDVKGTSVLSFAMFSVMPLTFFTGAFCADESYFKKVGYVLAIIFGLLALWAMFQFFFLNDYFLGQARHPLADPSSLGSLLSLALFCSLGWLLADRPQGEQKYAVTLSILLICGIISTVARGPVFAFIPGAVLLCLLLWPQIKARRKSLMIVALGAVVFYGVTLTGIQKSFDLGKRLFGTVVMEGDISNDRMEIWSSTLEMIKDHPLLGTGFGTFYLNYPQYRHITDVDGAAMAHNDPLQFWAELGVFGPLLFYAFCFAAAFRSFKALKNLQGHDRIIVASLLAGLAAMVVGSHVGFSHYNLPILMINGLLLSVWFVVSGRGLKDETPVLCMPKTSPALNRLLLVLPFAMILWLVLGIVAGDYYANRARDNLFAGKMTCINMSLNAGVSVTNDCLVENVNRANRVSHGLNYRVYMFAVNVPMSIMEDQKGKMTDEQATSLYLQVVDYMQTALAINPHAGDAYYYLAKVQGMIPAKIVPKGTPTPEEYYKKALALDPMLLGARLDLYNLYKAKNRPNSDLLAVLEPGLNFYYTTPMAPEYYGVLGRVYLDMKNYGKMQQTAQLGYNFLKRSNFSEVRQETSIPKAILDGGQSLPKFR